ncbi:MAG TPA: cell division topological specificity factor MinE [Candidatus Aphodoplasma excrementigallinarum]|uniref:Cell division topological specificity factor n=1 Tax=Candidatus Aphodoplasma excrementigallinarum TaxID=2840673 RepID=A0A9D1NHM2_9FIRM|nr:cell division topological specificity factor MinE [Candidatus Aphodoplasma excrementigallinarum]
MDFFGLFKNKKKGSGSAAKERLQFVLVHDRAGVSPEFLDQLKGEIMEVISKYIEIDQNELEIQVTRTKSEDGERVVPALVANIPINKMKANAGDKKNKK